MADTVRSLLEEMVPELEDLERRGYFSRSEIRQVVAKRQEFEYALKRRAAVKQDYLRYIEYESGLERLRQLRRKERGIAGRPSLADHCIARRIHFIYERCLRKFRGDLALWSRWLHHCRRTGAARQTSKVLTKALQLHSTSAALWTYAAAWEFEHNGNATAARALMQRGLRMCDGSAAMWHEYFRIEALYAARLAARREVLGIAGGEGEGEGAAADAASGKVVRGAVAAVVYRNAVAALPDSLAFRAKFLDVLGPLNLPGKEELQEAIYKDIQSAFGGTVGAVELQAQRCLQQGGGGANGDALTAALAVYEGALRERPSQELLEALLSFLEGQLQAALERHDPAASLHLARCCLGVVEGAAAAGVRASKRLQLAAPRMHLRMGGLEAALQAAEAAQGGAGRGREPAAAPVQRQLMTLRAAAAALGVSTPPDHPAPAPAPAPASEVAAVRGAGGGRSAEAWLCAIRLAAAGAGSLQALAEELVAQQRGCAKGQLKGGMGAAAGCLVAALWSCSDPAPARRLYRSLLALPLPGGSFVHTVLDLELALVAAGSQAALPRAAVVEIFEAGVGAYGDEDVDLWLRYMRFEQGQAGGRGGGAVHWRAVKALRDADEFSARAHLLHLGHGSL